MKKKPLHLRLKNRYITLRSKLLRKLGICSGCGWRWHKGEYCCDKCYWKR